MGFLNILFEFAYPWLRLLQKVAAPPAPAPQHCFTVTVFDMHKETEKRYHKIKEVQVPYG
jgi:hypothetical protein